MKQRLAWAAATVAVLAAMALFHAGPTRAEGGCPDGYFPIGGGNAGWQGCAPMGGDGDDGAGQPPPQWETRWGAVATTNGAFGYSFNWPTERQAIAEALAQCSRDAGGASCTIRQSYYDQCIALAWGQKGSNTVSAPEIGQAEQLALANCSERAADCKIYYSGCSYPERVR
ncbi:MAG: DUF4189 domain-containing protein [Sphingomonadales bacterium]|nr:DUF4189 domain-containing protein [Sphingomonadales bacterium]MBD3771960.1 DUF4189 domain-containing protein [Paracoccaceae bacterium]